MRNNEIEKKLSAEIEARTPNNYKKVLSACGSVERKEKVLTMKKRSSFVKWASSIAAALVLVIALTAVIGMQINSDTITSVVSIDVNPGIELSIGKNDTVKKVVATNDDGTRILEGLELKNVDVDTAVSTIIGEMLKAGYISADANSVLITVDTKSAESEELRQHLSDSVTKLLKAESIEAAVVTQVVTDDLDDAVKALAREHQMSHGKARLICELVTRGGAHTFDELKALTVNELLLLLDATGTTPDDVTGSGNASDSAYIGKDAVLAIALEAAGLTAEQVVGVEVELDYKKGAMIYEVEFESGSTEYEYKIEASTGEILKSKVEADDEDDDDDHDYDHDHKVERPENLIGKEAAVNAALVAAGFAYSQAGEIECDLECKGGIWFYEIEFEVEENEYEYRIDATSAEVLNSEVEADDDHDDDRDDHDDDRDDHDDDRDDHDDDRDDHDDDRDDHDDDRDDYDDDRDDHDDDEQKKDPSHALPENLIGEEAAINAAITAAGLSAEQVIKNDCDLERKGKSWIYEVELETADAEYRYIIDAVSSAILSERNQADDNKPDDDKAPETAVS